MIFIAQIEEMAMRLVEQTSPAGAALILEMLAAIRTELDCEDFDRRGMTDLAVARKDWRMADNAIDSAKGVIANFIDEIARSTAPTTPDAATMDRVALGETPRPDGSPLIGQTRQSLDAVGVTNTIPVAWMCTDNTGRVMFSTGAKPEADPDDHGAWKWRPVYYAVAPRPKRR